LLDIITTRLMETLQGKINYSEQNHNAGENIHPILASDIILKRMAILK